MVGSICTGWPNISKTGEAAPVSVPGAIASISAESKMKKPAEAAREPVGYTYVTTGTFDDRIAPIIWRIEVSRPPGVFIVVRIRPARLRLALAMPFTMYSARTGSISELICSSTTGAEPADAVRDALSPRMPGEKKKANTAQIERITASRGSGIAGLAPGRREWRPKPEFRNNISAGIISDK